MTDWKDVLCLVAIFLAYGLVGHLDYQDAVAMEQAMCEDAPQPCYALPRETEERPHALTADAMPPCDEASVAISHPACGPDND